MAKENKIKATLSAMVALSGNHDTVTCTSLEIAVITKQSRRNAIRNCNDLVNMGIIKRLVVKRGTKGSVTYHIDKAKASAYLETGKIGSNSAISRVLAQK